MRKKERRKGETSRGREGERDRIKREKREKWGKERGRREKR